MDFTRSVRPAILLCGVAGLALFVRTAQADSVVPATFNGLIVNNTTGQPGWGGFGDFSYNGADTTQVSSVGPYGAFVYDSDAASGGDLMNGSGAGYNSALNSESPFDQLTGHVFDIKADDFPILDRAGFGHNFNPDNYEIQVVYRPLPTNEAPVFNIQFDTHDGFVVEDRDGLPGFGEGKRSGEQHQWGFGYTDDQGNGMTIQEFYDANQKDSDGFVTISTPLSDGAGGVGPDWTFTGPTFLFNSGDQTFQGLNTIQGEGAIDFGTFEDLAPNGIGQVHIQSAFTDDESIVGRLHIEVKRITVVPINPDPTLVGRLDAMSGISRRFGTPFSTQTNPDGSGAIDNADSEFRVIRELDQLQRFDQNGFTNLIIQTDDDDETGGFGIWQEPGYQVFDGNEATVEIRAKLVPLNPNAQEAGDRAASFGVVLNDMDGDDSAGVGGEEYRYEVQTADLSEDAFTTLQIPLTDFTSQQAFEFVNPGDGLLDDFNLYYMGIVTNPDAGLVGVEIEYIEIRLPSTALPGDFNGDGTVDAADYTVWRDGLGSEFTASDYEVWRDNYGASQGGVASAAPEPACVWLLGAAAGPLAARRRRARPCC